MVVKFPHTHIHTRYLPYHRKFIAAHSMVVLANAEIAKQWKQKIYHTIFLFTNTHSLTYIAVCDR